MTNVFGPYPATVVDVHDGDTMTLDLDLGFNIRFRSACRVYGINAPELNTIAGRNAREAALSMIKPGDGCSVISHGWDKYGGRFDGAIILADGASFGDAMLSGGYAKPYFGTGPKP